TVHRLGGQEVALGGLTDGWAFEVVMRAGIDRDLVEERRRTAIACPPRHHCRQVAAGAVTADDETARVSAELGGVAGHPERGGVGVLDRGRELVLRREAVVTR